MLRDAMMEPLMRFSGMLTEVGPRAVGRLLMGYTWHQLEWQEGREGKERDKKREEAGAFTVNPNGWPAERVVPSKQVMVTVCR